MFNNARFRLTAWYLLTIMIVSLFFSGVIFKILTSEFDRISQFQKIRIEKRIGENIPKEIRNHLPPPPQFMDQEVIEESKTRLVWFLFFINSFILFISGILGYILAGITLRPIKEMVEEQNRFVTDASHELRTPLTALKLSMEVFLRDKKASLPEAKNLITSSIEEVDKLHALSENLLSLSQYQHNAKRPILEKNLLSEMVEEALKKVKFQADKKQIAIEYKKVNADILVNKYEFIDLLVILLDNAVKYSDIGKKIFVKVEKKSNHLDLHIIDRGVGIAKEDLPMIFDRFYRTDLARSKPTSGGYGLGLSIAKKIAKRNNVQLMVDSTLGKGTDFSVRVSV